MKFFKQSFTGYMIKYTSRKLYNVKDFDITDRGYLQRRLNSVYRRRLPLDKNMQQMLHDVQQGDSVMVNNIPYVVTKVDANVFSAKQRGRRNGENVFYKYNGVCIENKKIRATKVI